MSGPWEQFQQGRIVSGPWEQFQIGLPQAEPEKQKTGMIESLLRGGAEGATFGFDSRLGLDKNARAKSKADNPWTHFAGELIGGFAPVVATGGAAAAVKGGTSLFSKISQQMLRPLTAAPAATATQAAVQGAKVGGSYGALSGLGHSEMDGLDGAAVDTLKGGAVGAGLGGALGPMFYKVGEKLNIARAARDEMKNVDTASLSAIDRALARDRIDPTTLKSQIAPPPASNNANAMSSDEIVRAATMRAEGKAAGEIAATLGRAPNTVRQGLDRFDDHNAVPVSLVDRARMTGPSGGENTSWTLRAAMASPGEGRAVAAETLTARQMDQASRLTNAADRLVKTSDPAARQIAMKQAEKQAYGQAEAVAQPFDLSGIVQSALQQNAGYKDKIATGVTEGAKMFAPTAVGPATPAAGLQSFQRSKLALDQMIEDSMNTGKATPLTRQLMQLKTELMNEVSATNPQWRAANDMFADNAAARRLFQDAQGQTFRLTADSSKELAVVEGLHRTVASKSVTAADKAAAQTQIDLYRDGLAEAIKNQVLNKGEGHDHVARLLTPAAQKIIKGVLGEKDAAALMRVLRAEEATTRSYRGLGGSQTTPLRETINELNGPSMLASGLDLLNPRALLQALVAKGAAKMSEARNNRMTPMLVESDVIKQLKLLTDVETMRAARTVGGKVGLDGIAPLSNAIQDQARPAPRPMMFGGFR